MTETGEYQAKIARLEVENKKLRASLDTRGPYNGEDMIGDNGYGTTEHYIKSLEIENAHLRAVAVAAKQLLKTEAAINRLSGEKDRLSVVALHAEYGVRECALADLRRALGKEK